MLKKAALPPKPLQATPRRPAPPVYRPPAPAGIQPKHANSGAAGNQSRPTWPPVYRPNVPSPKAAPTAVSPQPLVRAQTGRVTPPPVQAKPAAPMALPTYRPLQAKPVPLSKPPARTSSGPVTPSWNHPGTIQRASKSKEQLEEEFNDAMRSKDFDRADELDAMMAELPGDSAQSFGSGDGDDYDLTYKNKQVRFSFTKGLRASLTAKQTVGGKLRCALGASCYVSKTTGTDEIKVNSSGKEVWTSGSGNVHETAPPIDHYSPDWKDRLAALMKKNYDVQNFKLQGEALYNAPPLRIIHMTCNSKRNGG